MSTVNKLGNNRYLATSKNVNRMLNQLNGILASDNISFQNISATSASTSISFANGNFINLTLQAGSNTLTFSNYNPGVYYLRVIQGSATTCTITWPSIVKKPSITLSSGTLNQYDMLTMVCDGTNFYITGVTLNLT